MSCITWLSREARLSRGARIPLNVRGLGLAVGGGSRGAAARPRGHSRVGLGSLWVPGSLWGPAGRSHPGQKEPISLTGTCPSWALADSPLAPGSRENQDRPGSRRPGSGGCRRVQMVGSGLRTHLHTPWSRWSITVLTVLTLKTAGVSVSNLSTTLVAVFGVQTGSPRGPCGPGTPCWPGSPG